MIDDGTIDPFWSNFTKKGYSSYNIFVKNTFIGSRGKLKFRCFANKMREILALKGRLSLLYLVCALCQFIVPNQIKSVIVWKTTSHKYHIRSLLIGLQTSKCSLWKVVFHENDSTLFYIFSFIGTHNLPREFLTQGFNSQGHKVRKDTLKLIFLISESIKPNPNIEIDCWL